MHRQTLARSEKVLGLEHADTLASMNNLALLLDIQGKYKEAESMHRQRLAISEKVLGKEHPNALMSMNNLALMVGAKASTTRRSRRTGRRWRSERRCSGLTIQTR
jgi:hypothetical protein